MNHCFGNELVIVGNWAMLWGRNVIFQESRHCEDLWSGNEVPELLKISQKKKKKKVIRLLFAVGFLIVEKEVEMQQI